MKPRAFEQILAVQIKHCPAPAGNSLSRPPRRQFDHATCATIRAYYIVQMTDALARNVDANRLARCGRGSRSAVFPRNSHLRAAGLYLARTLHNHTMPVAASKQSGGRRRKRLGGLCRRRSRSTHDP
ncbi:MAG TPA: hypothetical protein VE775_01500 [Pyrinomonadaceae bacterium]|nr:hypothetical protein [Pyrinomonadaceae bacterium]